MSALRSLTMCGAAGLWLASLALLAGAVLAWGSDGALAADLLALSFSSLVLGIGLGIVHAITHER